MMKVNRPLIYIHETATKWFNLNNRECNSRTNTKQPGSTERVEPTLNIFEVIAAHP